MEDTVPPLELLTPPIADTPGGSVRLIVLLFAEFISSPTEVIFIKAAPLQIDPSIMSIVIEGVAVKFRILIGVDTVCVSFGVGVGVVDADALIVVVMGGHLQSITT